MLTTGEILSAFFYSALFFILISRLRFFKTFSLPPRLIAWIFIFKVLTGTAYGLLHFYLYAGGDTFAYFNDGLIAQSSLPGSPAVFLKLALGINIPPPSPEILPYARSMGYWNNMSSYCIVRFHALAGLLTFGHYYGNMVIYNFLTLIGFLYLFRFARAFMAEKKTTTLATLFFFPAVAFWSSGVHKDGVSIAALGILLYFTATFFQFIPSGKTKPPLWHSIAGMAAGIILLLAVRNYLLMLVFPPLAALTWTLKSKDSRLLKFIACFVIFYVIVFSIGSLFPDYNLVAKMTEEQNEFSRLILGRSELMLPAIDSSLPKLFRVFPIALKNCLFEPLPWHLSSPIQIIPLIDNLAVLLLAVLTFCFWKRNDPARQSFFLFSIFFALSVFIFTGSIVPNAGALVRYKMPGTLFLVLGCLSAIDGQKIRNFAGRRIATRVFS